MQRKVRRFAASLGIPNVFRRRASLYITLLSLLGFVICATIVLFTDSEKISAKQSSILYAVYTNVFLMLVLVCVVYRDFLKLWKSRKSRGSILQMKLITMFSSLAVVPSFLMIFFSAIFFHKGIESWFNARNNAVLRESLNVAESYLSEHRQMIKNDGLGIARAIEINIASLTPSQINDEEIFASTISELMDELFAIKNIDGGMLFDRYDRVLARSKYSMSLNFVTTSPKDLEEAVVSGIKVMNDTDDNKVMAIMRINVITKGHVFLLIEKKVDEKILGYIKKTKSAYSDYHELANYRTSLEIAFILIFIILGVLLLLAAIAAAINFAGRLIVPISNLVESAEKIKDGNWNARAESAPFVKELDLLTNTFNEMIARVQEQQENLKEANLTLDQQVQFISDVLSGVSSGVISLNDRFRINIFNNQAEKLLGKRLDHGMLIFDIFSNISDAFDKLKNNETTETQIEYIKGLEHREFTVKLAKIVEGVSIAGYILTFDDVTNLISAQRKAAWADVARRVAHEIKNPLTPIQLAAERISRKYSSQISTDIDIFNKLTDTIVRQVGDIRRLADEFSFFARLPEPTLRKCVLAEITKQAVFFMQNAYQDVDIDFTCNVDNTDIIGDDRLIHQAIINVMQNAINAMKNAKDRTCSDKICISFQNDGEYVRLYIDDNGPGLPKAERNMLTEPYFTLMPKGTGLGLAIVKKIVQDHNGHIELSDSDMAGARIALSFPSDTKDKK